MKFNHLVTLLPCQSLEDFSLDRKPDEAQQLLSAWSALWHPALLISARDMPGWLPAYEPPQEPAGHLVTLPDCSVGLLPDGWLPRAESAGACVLRNLRDREQLVATALEHLDAAESHVDPELAADFLALGFCYLLVELLTRQLRYMSNLDEESFRCELLAAAEEALKGDGRAARDRLQSAFDLLHEGREYFYPVEAHLLDLTLVAPTTLGASLRAELAGQTPTNLLVSGEVIREMARREPATREALTDALQNNRASLVGGEFGERELPLLSPEAIRYHLLRGLEAYQEHLGTRPTVFGRRRFGLSPMLPQILEKLGFSGAVHSTLDDGRFPTGNQSRIQWKGLDGTLLEALARVPIDIGRADAFLRLPERLGNSMDLDHVATVILAHWPGQSSPWYRDLRRIAGYSPALGTFSTIDAYFDETGMAGQQTQYRPDQYRSPYLKQAVAAGSSDPISRWTKYFARRAAAEATQTLQTLAILVASNRATSSPAAGGLTAEVEESLATESDPGDALDRKLQSHLDGAVARFSQAVTGPDQRGGHGYLVANPGSFSRRLCLEMPELARSPEVAGAVRAVGDKSVVVDVPAMGFAWVGPGPETAPVVEPAQRKGWKRKRNKPKDDPPLAEENLLRNEFFEVALDPPTGAIRSIADYSSRSPRLAQQIALRRPQPGADDAGDDLHYSIMAADELRVTSAGPILGEIVCRGRLVDREARRLAGFAQTTRVWRGSRVIELQIELDVDQPPGPNPWNSYYAARFAWSDATANLYRSVSLANLPTDATLIEAPHFVDIRAGQVRTTLLCGGLPCHRRFGLRKLDTLLVVRGETARRFRLGIGIDLPHPVPAALGFLAPQTMLAAAAPPPAPSGWLFHLDARNVIATDWEPLLSDGGAMGFRVRLLETDGRKVRLGLRAFRLVESAQKIKSGDTPPVELPVEGDQVTIDLGPHEWVEMEARFVV